MADGNKQAKIEKEKSPLVGAQAQPTVLDKTLKLDIDTEKILIDNIIEAGISSNLDIGALEEFTSISNSREQMYNMIDTMAADSTVSSIIRTYTEDVCEVADNGHIIWCESADPNISKFVNYLLNTMNADKNIYNWVYNLIKYGDVYLKLFRESDYKDVLFKKDKIDAAYSAHTKLNESKESLDEDVNLNVHAVSDPYSYYVEAVADPSTMFELTKFGKTYGYIETPNEKKGIDTIDSYLNQTSLNYNGYKMKSNDVNIYQADDYVHACLEDNFTRYPETVDIFMTDNDYKNSTNSQSYTVKRGKSMLIDSYKIWREKALLETAALMNRITKSSLVRNVQLEVGDMPKAQAQAALRRIKELFEQKSAFDTGESYQEYTNPGPIENTIYTTTHDGKGTLTIAETGGDVNVKDLADLDWWNNKFYASYGIPKQFFGWCLKFDTPILLLDGTTHTIEELYNNKDIYIGKGIMGCNPDGTLCPTKITNIMLTNPAAKYMRIWLDNDKYIDVTPDHKMMLRDGTFIEASKLNSGDSLMPYYDKIKDGRRYVLDNKLGKFIPQCHLVSAAKGELIKILDTLNNYTSEVTRKVIKIEYFDEEVPVYDLTVADDCHTFALPCGIFVHNCEDGAGFNGGTSLSIISSVYSKGVKRVQNAIIQAITDIINLFLVNRGCNSYLNNFVLKMKTPLSQEEKDYRDDLSNRINAISNIQSLFSDVEDKARKLRVLKNLLSTLNYGDDLIQIIDEEIIAAEKAAKEEAELAAQEAATGESPEDLLDLGNEEKPSNKKENNTALPELDLGNSSEVPMESFENNGGNSSLVEEMDYLIEDELPTPEELAEDKDFTKNV